MAILEMNKISLIGLCRDKEELMESLMESGAVQITDIRGELPDSANDFPAGRTDPERNFPAGRTDPGTDIPEIEEKMQKVAEVLKRLEKFDRRKKGLFETRRVVSREAYDRVIHDKGFLWTTIKSIMWCDAKIAQLHTERNRYSNLATALGPWEQLRIPLERTSTRTSPIMLGYIPRRSNTDELEKALGDIGACHLMILNRDRDHIYLCLICHRSVFKEAGEVLKNFGFTKVPFDGLEGTAAENIRTAAERIEEIDRECERISKDMEDYAEDMEQLEILYDVLTIRRDLKKAEARLAGTRSTFLLTGWIPAHLSGQIAEKLQNRWVCEVHIRKAAEEEEFPVLLQNGRIGRSVEAITTLYSPPHSKEYDPNTVVGIFFILFFGLMLGDAGYGIFIILVTALLLRKTDMEEGMRNFVRLMLYCGISSVFWGAMFGGWFGLPQLAKYPLLIDPIGQPELFLGFSLALGIVHIFSGLGMKAIKLVQQKKYVDILLDVVIWYVFFTGFVFVILPYAFGGNPESVAPLVDAGKYMLAAGGMVIVLTHGRKNKGLVKKLSSGIGSLYGVIKFLSDVLSYSRLMALGLATSVIGIIVYDIASMNGLDNPLTFLGFVVIMLLGHALNFAIAMLSAYVHSSRLQYIEFFSRFYNGGGELFKPLRAETKYINLQEVMQSEHTIFGNVR